MCGCDLGFVMVVDLGTLPAGFMSVHLQVLTIVSFFLPRYLSDGASCLKKASNMLKTRYDELVNAMDMVGFTDEVSSRTQDYCSNIPRLRNTSRTVWGKHFCKK